MGLRFWSDSKVTAALSDLDFQRGQEIIRKREPYYYNHVRLGDRKVDVHGLLKRKHLLSQALQADSKQRHFFHNTKGVLCYIRNL